MAGRTESPWAAAASPPKVPAKLAAVAGRCRAALSSENAATDDTRLLLPIMSARLRRCGGCCRGGGGCLDDSASGNSVIAAGGGASSTGVSTGEQPHATPSFGVREFRSESRSERLSLVRYVGVSRLADAGGVRGVIPIIATN